MGNAVGYGSHDGRAPCRSVLLPVGVSVSLWAERQLAPAGSVTGGEQSVSLIAAHLALRAQSHCYV